MLIERYEQKRSKLLALALSALIVASGSGCARSVVAQRQVSVTTVDSSSEIVIANQYESERAAEELVFIDSVLTTGSVTKYYGVRSSRIEQTLVSHSMVENQAALYKENRVKGTELDIKDNGNTELSLTEDAVAFKSKNSTSYVKLLVGLLIAFVLLLFLAGRILKIP